MDGTSADASATTRKWPAKSTSSVPQAPLVKPRARQVNWFHPARFATIDAVAKRDGFQSPQAILQELQKGTAGLEFRTLHWGTILKWIDSENRCWNKATLAKVQLAKSQDSSDAPHLVTPGKTLGRPQILVRH